MTQFEMGQEALSTPIVLSVNNMLHTVKIFPVSRKKADSGFTLIKVS